MTIRMISRERLREIRRSWLARTILFALGILLLILTPVVGALPGPGGLFVFAAGMALALQNSDWAKRQYVRFKRWQPKAGAWMDWGLRRRSAKRREQRRKIDEKIDAPQTLDGSKIGPAEGQTN